jgi:hypothetical protein
MEHAPCAFETPNHGWYLALLWHIFERFGVFGIPELRLA